MQNLTYVGLVTISYRLINASYSQPQICLYMPYRLFTVVINKKHILVAKLQVYDTLYFHRHVYVLLLYR